MDCKTWVDGFVFFQLSDRNKILAIGTGGVISFTHQLHQRSQSYDLTGAYIN